MELKANLRADLPRIHADANQIQQVLVNLLLNANDAMGEDGGTLALRHRFRNRPAGNAPANVEKRSKSA